MAATSRQREIFFPGSLRKDQIATCLIRPKGRPAEWLTSLRRFPLPATIIFVLLTDRRADVRRVRRPICQILLVFSHPEVIAKPSLLSKRNNAIVGRGASGQGHDTPPPPLLLLPLLPSERANASAATKSWKKGTFKILPPRRGRFCIS